MRVFKDVVIGLMALFILSAPGVFALLAIWTDKRQDFSAHCGWSVPVAAVYVAVALWIWAERDL